MAPALLFLALAPVLGASSPGEAADPPASAEFAAVPSAGRVDEAMIANVAPPSPMPAGYTWTVDLGNGGFLDVKSPIATVETVMPLPLRLSTRGTDLRVFVEVCETYDCLLPRTVDVEPNVVVSVDALFSGRAPRLKIRHGEQQRECCDRGMGAGRAIAFAGPDARVFAFRSADDSNIGGVGAFAVDTGTFLAERPDLLDAFGAAIIDDGWRVPAMKDALRQFVRTGGVVSMARDDAVAIGLVEVDAASGAVTGAFRLQRSAIPAPGYGPVVANADGLGMRLEDRLVKLRFSEEEVVRVGGGVVILRGAGRGEEERLAAVPVAMPGFLNLAPQLDPRNVPVVNVAGAGLAPAPMGAPGFGLAFLATALIGVTLLIGLKRGPVAAARNTLVVGVLGAAALVGLRVVSTGGGNVAVAHWSPGQDSRRTTSAFARAPGSYGDVDVEGAPFAGRPTITAIVGDGSWRTAMRVDDGRVHADLGSSSGLVGVWFARDETAGALVQHDDGSLENTFAFDLDYVLVRREATYGEGELLVLERLAAGARVNDSEGRRLDHFGRVIEERLARDVFNSGNGGSAVGVFTRNGVVTAVEASR